MHRFTITYKLSEGDWNQVFMFGRDGDKTEMIYSGMELKEEGVWSGVVPDGPVTLEQAVQDLYILTLKPGAHIPEGTIDGISFMSEELDVKPDGLQVEQNNASGSD